MTDDAPTPQPPIRPAHVVTRRRAPSLIWLVPAAAALIGLTLVFNAWRGMGPQIRISFQTAEGLEIGKTLVKYRNVAVGRVTAIELADDQAHVIVTAELNRSAARIASRDTSFWVARPRFGIGWVSGLDTLLSGSYIGAEAGDSREPRRDFVGLEEPPALTHGLSGRRVVLHAQSVGSIALGAPVYYRRFEVGRVIERRLEADGGGAEIAIFIDAPNDRLISGATRFWNASGVDVTLGANGLKMKTESLATVLAGGIAFDAAPAVFAAGPVDGKDRFTLFETEAAAMAPPDGEPHYVRMRFRRSLRGLSPGAPVEFLGVEIGSVVSVDLDYEPHDRSFPVVVSARLYPRRMGRAYEALVKQGAATSDDRMARFVGELVARGLRGQPRLASLLTRQLYISLDFLPAAGAARYDVAARPLEIPTVDGPIDELQMRLASIVTKLDHLPLGSIAGHLDGDLADLHATLRMLNGELMPSASTAIHGLSNTLDSANRALDDDAPWRQNVDDTVTEARHTLRSVRALADYLSRHPEAVLRGRAAQAREPPDGQARQSDPR